MNLSKLLPLWCDSTLPAVVLWCSGSQDRCTTMSLPSWVWQPVLLCGPLQLQVPLHQVLPARLISVDLNFSWFHALQNDLQLRIIVWQCNVLIAEWGACPLVSKITAVLNRAKKWASNTPAVPCSPAVTHSFPLWPDNLISLLPFSLLVLIKQNHSDCQWEETTIIYIKFWPSERPDKLGQRGHRSCLFFFLKVLCFL